MTTTGDTERKIRTIVMRSRRYLRSQNKAITSINGSMFLNSVVSDIILDCPIRFQIPGELKRIAVFIQLTFRCLLLQFFLLKSFIAERMGSRLHQAGINSYSFVDGQPLGG